MCLGFQLIIEQEGSIIIRQNQVCMVETEMPTDFKTVTYRKLQEPIKVGRYHSLQVDPKSLKNLPSNLRITAQDPIRKTPLSFEDLDQKLFGLQYHPESFLSNRGKQIISNILDESMA